MRRRALPAAVSAALLLLGGAWFLSRKPVLPPPRLPAHAALSSPDDPVVKLLLEDVGRLRRIRAVRPVPMGGVGDREYEEALDRIRQGSPRALFHLEQVALRPAESVSLRIDLINVIAGHRDEETRKFLSSLVIDPMEDPAVRIAALEPFMKYRDLATFEALKSAWLDPLPFQGRYHLCRAFGENGQPGAIPLLRGAIAHDRSPDVRAHAALGLGGFVADPGIRAGLKALAQSDADPAVRQNAIRSLCRSGDSEVDGFLRELAASGATDAGTKRVAQDFLRQRARNP